MRQYKGRHLQGAPALYLTTQGSNMAISRQQLTKKRKKALWALVGGAGTTGASVVIPTPGWEVPKQAVVATADIVTLAGIYNIYFDEDIGVQGVKDMLLEMGLVVTTGGAVAYGSIKVTEGIIHEVLNWIPVIGWVAKGVITGSVTLTVGTLWLWVCDTALRQDKSPVAVFKQAFG
jgi:hypothetical protein